MSRPGDQRTAQTSHSENIHTYPDGIRQAGFIIRRNTGGVTAWMRHPNVTWTRVGTTLTCTWGGGGVPNHEFVNGDSILVRDCSSSLALISNAYYVVSSVTATTFQITGINAGDASGHFCGYEVVDLSANATVRSGLDLQINARYPIYPVLSDGGWETAPPRLGMPFPGNTVYGVDNEDLHNVLGMGIDSEGRFWLAGSTHAAELNAVYSNPDSIKNWTAPYVGGGGSYPFLTGLTGMNYHTYHHFLRLPDGRMLWMTDQQEASTSRGRDYIQAIKAVGVTNAWTPVQSTWEFVVSNNIANTEYGSQDVPANRVYVTACTVHEDKIHYSITWRIWDGLEEGAKYASYVWSYLSDLTKVYNIHGDEMTMPLTHGATAAARDALGHYVYESDLTHFVSGSGQGIAIDRFGRPHIQLTIQEHDSSGAIDGTSTGFRDHYWDGSAWQISSVLSGGANGPTYMPLGDDLVLLTEGTGPSGRAARMREQNGLYTFYLGATASTYSPMCDPIALRERGVLSIQVTDYDDPWVYEFGGHAKRDAARIITTGAKTADGSETLDMAAGSFFSADWQVKIPAFSGFTDVTITCEESSDNTTWIPLNTNVVTAAGDYHFATPLSRRYARVTWDVNGAGSITLNVFIKRRRA
jgi:hypothetical protein